jgi:hypothetical protein
LLCHESTIPSLYNRIDLRHYDKIAQLANCANEPRNKLKDNIFGANFRSQTHYFYVRKQGAQLSSQEAVFIQGAQLIDDTSKCQMLGMIVSYVLNRIINNTPNK